MHYIDQGKQLIVVIGLLIISWWGAVDNLASFANAASIKDAAVIYGVARSINGVISLIQSAELGAIIGSINPGELLDPVNDLIERFSSVMAWSLSSLVLQKILISVFGSYSFKVIFSICCLFVLAMGYFIKSAILLRRVWVVFLLVSALRFSVAIAGSLTALVDVSFIKQIEQNSFENVKKFNQEISIGINNIPDTNENLDEQIDNLENNKDELKELIVAKSNDLSLLKENFDKADERSFFDRLRRKGKTGEAQTIDTEIEITEASIKSLGKKLKDLENQIECANLRQEGSSCEGFISTLKKLSANKIAEISIKIDQTINDLITVLVSLVLTTIIFPLAFLYLSYRVFKMLIIILQKNIDALPDTTIKSNLS